MDELSDKDKRDLYWFCYHALEQAQRATVEPRRSGNTVALMLAERDVNRARRAFNIACRITGEAAPTLIEALDARR